MSSSFSVIVVALLYGCCAFLAIRFVSSLCDKIVPFDDGPEPGRPPTGALIVGAVVVGGVLASRGLAVPALGIFGILIVSLVACWYSDVRCGIVPDYFTLAPLAVVLAVSLAGHDGAPIISAAIVFVPFAIAAFFSKGRGMGWGDVKIIALGAAVLGLNMSIVAFATACLAAVAIAAVRRRRAEPIAFAPYLAASIALAIALPLPALR
jgi:prepilin signal peptidase PulO-like enzyme (type II secretory pathway)